MDNQTKTADNPQADVNTPGNHTEWCMEWIPETPFTDSATKGVAVKASLWQPGANISVSFLDGDPALQERVKKAALKWTGVNMANLHLIFRKDTNDTDIRISFKYAGSWSTIGTSCRQVTNKTQPTMNYGWLTPNSTDAELERVVLHEFGHAIGLTHEHLHPVGGIPWNKEQVYKDLSGPPNNWSKATIDNNMFNVLSVNQTNFTALDKNSIMMYPIPAKWTTNGFTVGLNNNLSETDKAFIRQQYP